jgi:D-alanyl-D-alanine carboxypeptidase
MRFSKSSYVGTVYRDSELGTTLCWRENTDPVLVRSVDKPGLSILACFVLILCAGCGGGGEASSGGAGSGSGGDGGSVSAGGWQGCAALPASNQPSGSLGGLVDAAVASKMKSTGMPGITVAVAKNGKLLYAQGYGYADLSTCQPMPADAEMQIGSLTKQFTAAAVLQLQKAGLVDIDRTVVSYLPAYAFDPRITLRMLLNQTSGLQDYIDFPSLRQYGAGGAAESVALNAIVEAPLLFAPGSAYSYSNSNYFILGSVIEAVTSQTYPDYLQASVFTPAGLNNTFYTRPSPSASPYIPGPSGPVAGTIPDPSAYFAAGALWSNVQDLATWDAALLAGKVVAPELLKLLVTPAAVPYFQQSIPSDYGMGWILGGSVAGHPFVWHNGQTVSYTSFNGVFTDDGFSLTVLTNYSVPEPAALLSFGETLIQGICNAPATAGDC